MNIVFEPRDGRFFDVVCSIPLSPTQGSRIVHLCASWDFEANMIVFYQGPLSDEEFEFVFKALESHMKDAFERENQTSQKRGGAVITDEPYSLGSYIRHKRKAAGLSTTQVGKALGVSQNWMAQIERGRKGATLKPELWGLLMDAVPGITLEELVQWSKV